MKTMQTWGWLAAGVLAAGLNASYHDGGFEWARRVADRVVDRVQEASSLARDLASGRADLFLTEAQLFLQGNEDSSSHLATTLARVQTRISRAQTECARGEAHAQARAEQMSARQQAALDRAEAERDRMGAQRQRMEDRMEAERDRIQARLAQIRIATLAPVAFRAPQPPACPPVRVRLPRLPKITIPAASIHVEAPAVDPI